MASSDTGAQESHLSPEHGAVLFCTAIAKQERGARNRHLRFLTEFRARAAWLAERQPMAIKSIRNSEFVTDGRGRRAIAAQGTSARPWRSHDAPTHA